MVNTKIKSMFATTKAALGKTKGAFHQQTGLQCKEETSKVLRLEHKFCMAVKLGHFGNYIRNCLKFLKLNAREGWRRSV